MKTKIIGFIFTALILTACSAPTAVLPDTSDPEADREAQIDQAIENEMKEIEELRSRAKEKYEKEEKERKEKESAAKEITPPAPVSSDMITASTAISSTDEYDAFAVGRLKEVYGSNYILSPDGDTMVISVWKDGTALDGAGAKGGDEALTLGWEDALSENERVSSELYEALVSNGFPYKHLTFMVRNDINKDHILLTFTDGKKTYDATQ